MNENLPADAPMKRLDTQALDSALYQQAAYRDYHLARELAACYCPMATKVEVEGDDEVQEDGRVSTNVSRVNFYDSQGEKIELEDEAVAWHIIQNSPELRSEFFLQEDFAHDPQGAVGWLTDQLYQAQHEYYDLIGDEIDLRNAPPPALLYVKRDDGSYKLADDGDADRLRRELNGYEAWLSARAFLDRYAPMGAGVEIEYSAEYNDEGGYYSSVSDLTPLDENGHPLDLDDPQVALECIQDSPDLAEAFEGSDPEEAPEFLKEQLRDNMYEYDWNGFDRIFTTKEAIPPEAYAPEPEPGSADMPEEAVLERT